MKIGICTGGGDCPGLNAVIRAVVHHAIGVHGWEVFGIQDSFDGLISRPYQIRKLSINDVSGILDRGGTILGTRSSGNPFSLKRSNSETQENKSGLVIDAYKELGLSAIIVVGGDGTQGIAYRLSSGINIVGVPKTIDNDLAATDETIGFNTAVQTAAEALSRLRSTAESHERIMVLEVMGRDAGHIALHCGIAGGANVILLPEIPFTYDPIVSKIESRRKLGRYFSLVVVAEGAHEVGQKPVFKTSLSGSQQLGGIGDVVAHELHKRTQLETRITVLGHVQRGGTPTPYDRVLGTVFGMASVELVKQRKFGHLVSMQGGKITSVRYEEVAGNYRPVPDDSIYMKTAEAIGICLGRPSDFHTAC